MSNEYYDYEIKKLLAQYGDKPDSGEERICGNCFLYDADHWRCRHYENAEDGAIYDETESGCWYHRSHEEQKRLADFVKKHCDEANRLRLEEQRRDGTGDCAGCPFREMQAMLEKIVKFNVLAGYWDMINDRTLRESVELLLKKARGEE